MEFFQTIIILRFTIIVMNSVIYHNATKILILLHDFTELHSHRD